MSGETFPVRSHDFVVRDFIFHTGRAVPELRLHCRTLGDPAGSPVLVLHGTAGCGEKMLAQPFAGELFGPGNPLDAASHFLIFPDSLGAGRSAKPSDGLPGNFPRPNYADLVGAHYRLVQECLRPTRLRPVPGFSTGGMPACP